MAGDVTTTVGAYAVAPDDLSRADTLALLALHLAGMHADTPAGQVNALDLSGLRGPDVTVWSVRTRPADRVVALGALKLLGGDEGEVKSMRTHPDHLRRGIAATLLAHLVDVARASGLARLRLETGSGPAFAPALALYRRHGFVDGEAFGDYVATGFNRFLTFPL